MFLAAVVALGLLVTPQLASADSIITYTGNHYADITDTTTIAGVYDTTMFVSATIDLANGLGANFDGLVTPIHFSLNDGRFTITDLFPSSVFHFTTDSSGAITKWYLEVHNNFGADEGLIIQSAHDTAVLNVARDMGDIVIFSTGKFDAGLALDSGGSWSASVPEPASLPVPEPASLSQLAIGLAGLGFLLRKRMS
jgi:hypothetical protein